MKEDNPVRTVFLEKTESALSSSLALDMVGKLETMFVRGLDVEFHAKTIDWDKSYTTLHDHSLGFHLLEKTSILDEFDRFVGRGNVAALIGVPNDKIGGSMLIQYATDVSAQIEMIMNRDTSAMTKLATFVGRKLKSSDWWMANFDQINKKLRKNRARLNRVKAVMEK